MRQLPAFPGLWVKSACVGADHLEHLVFPPKEGMPAVHKDRPAGRAGRPELLTWYCSGKTNCMVLVWECKRKDNPDSSSVSNNFSNSVGKNLKKLWPMLWLYSVLLRIFSQIFIVSISPDAISEAWALTTEHCSLVSFSHASHSNEAVGRHTLISETQSQSTLQFSWKKGGIGACVVFAGY